jgi:ElaA protein
MNWILKTWTELNTTDLFEAYKLRTDVFVVEQGCPYPEVDNHDLKSKHLFLWDKNVLAAYARITPPGTVYPQPSIGRIVILESYRGQGLGKDLVARSLEALREDYAGRDIKIQAQEYLNDFYGSFGFKTISPSYPDALVMHVDMLLSASE